MKRIIIQESNGNKILLNNDIQINSELLLGGDAYSKNFFRNLYLDVLCPVGSFSN